MVTELPAPIEAKDDNQVVDVRSADSKKHGETYSILESVEETDNRQGDGYLGKYRRSFRSRHVQILSFGSNVGSGIFISTGKALRNSGPGNMVIGYFCVMIMVIAALQTLTEMTVAFPVSGNLIDFADRFLDPAVSFAIGFAEWLAWTTVLASEGAAFNVVVQYWTSNVPVAVWSM